MTDTDLGRLLVFIKIDPETGEEKRSDAITNAVDKDKNKEPGYFVKWNYEYDLERRS